MSYGMRRHSIEFFEIFDIPSTLVICRGSDEKEDGAKWFVTALVKISRIFSLIRNININIMQYMLSQPTNDMSRTLIIPFSTQYFRSFDSNYIIDYISVR